MSLIVNYPNNLRSIAYSTDGSSMIVPPKKVFLPSSILEVKAIILGSDKVVIRGGGSGFVGGSLVNNDDSVILSTARLSEVIDLDRTRMTITVGSGMTLSSLNDFLSDYDLEFPLLPLNHSTTTVGSMVALNSSGFRSFKYKRVYDWVEGLSVVDSKGQLLEVGKLDLNNFLGMEGITGIIVSVKLKLIKRVRTRSMTFYRADNISKLVELTRRLKSDPNISSVLLFGKDSSVLLSLSNDYHLVVEFEDLSGEIKGSNYLEKYSLVLDVHDSLVSKGYSRVVDPKIFLDKVSIITEFLESNHVPHFFEFGSGTVYSYYHNDNTTYARIHYLFKNIRRLRGGITSGFGIGSLSKEFLDDVEKKLALRIKVRCDGINKFNPGVLVDFVDNKFDNPVGTFDSYDSSESVDDKVHLNVSLDSINDKMYNDMVVEKYDDYFVDNTAIEENTDGSVVDDVDGSNINFKRNFSSLKDHDKNTDDSGVDDVTG